MKLRAGFFKGSLASANISWGVCAAVEVALFSFDEYGFVYQTWNLLNVNISINRLTLVGLTINRENATFVVVNCPVTVFWG